MGNYLNNVARRTAGASLLRPRVASRFEPVRGTGVAMSSFREETVERQAEVPRAMPSVETRVPAPPRTQTVETTLRHAETLEPKPALRETVQEPGATKAHSIVRQEADLRETPLAGVRQDQTRETAVNAQPGRTKEVIIPPVPVAKEVTGERIQPRPQPRPTQILQTEAPETVKPFAPEPRFPAPSGERREQPGRHVSKPPVSHDGSQARSPEHFFTSLAEPRAQFAAPQYEMAPPSVQVVIGKVTVQASLPSAPAQAPARAAAQAGPRLSLERYLDRRGGRS